MNAEPELYPPEALVDEEPRYLRRQKPVEIRRRKFGRRGWAGYRRWMLAGAGVFAGGFFVYQTAHFILFSPRVQLSSFDQIEIVGGNYVSRSAITEKFSADLGKSILRVPLDRRRDAIEAIPWVAQASIERALPNRIRIELTERTPVAFLRMGRELALADADGVILDRPLEGDFHFPVAVGLSDSMPLPDRARRMRLLVEFLKEIELASPGAGDHVSEVDLADAQDLRAMLAGLPGLEQQGPVLVHFGEGDFVNKYRLLTENIGQWRTSAGRVESVDLRFARQVVVNPETEAAKPHTVAATIPSARRRGRKR